MVCQRGGKGGGAAALESECLEATSNGAECQGDGERRKQTSGNYVSVSVFLCSCEGSSKGELGVQRSRQSGEPRKRAVQALRAFSG